MKNRSQYFSLNTAQNLASVLFAFVVFAANINYLFAQTDRKKWEEPQNLAVLNTAHDDFAPAFSAQERLLYYSSVQNGMAQFFTSKFEIRRDAASGEVRPRFGASEFVRTSLNQPATNQAYITFAKDGTILFSAYRMAKTRPFLNIFAAGDRTNTFPKPVSLDALNTDDFNAHPSLSPSGKTVVFASTRTYGGRGGVDLWTANRDESGAWQPPVNMGDVLNSTNDEITPFLAAEDSLYFASNGFGGKGGFEIFLSVRVEGRWQAPVPLTELNSEADDSDFTMLPGLNGVGIGVFASNRAGGRGGLDLYVSRFLPVSQITSAVEYKITTQTNFLTLEEFLMTDVFPLAPCIFFDPNASSLPQGLKQLSADANETAQFSPQNLRPDAMTLYAETLNILGKRLAELPSATLQLSTLETSNIALSRQRVEAIRTYLQNVWNIDGKRILSATATAAQAKRRILGFAGEDAVRCVEVSSSDPRICAPVRIVGVNVLAKPRKLEVALDARPRPQMRSWTFALLGDGKDTVFRTTGYTLPFAMTLPLEASAWANVPEELTARFMGTDSLGRTGKRELVLVAYRLPLEQKRAQKVQDKLIERYRCLVPRTETDAALALSAEQSDLVREITTSLAGSGTNGVSITISPFSFDEKSSPSNTLDRAAKLLTDELRKQATLLQPQQIQTEALTETQSPETPEERVIGRVLVITVERTVQTPDRVPDKSGVGGKGK